MKLICKDNESKSVELNDSIFSVEFKEPLVHQAVVTYLSGQRAGTKAQKNRAAVSGGGAKPWRQKGTGRARAGTTRGPIWRKGGVTFAAAPRDHSKKLNKKMYRGAIRSILSELVREEVFTLVETLAVNEAKTKQAVALLSQYDAATNSLLLVDSIDESLRLAVRNLDNVEVSTVSDINPYSLVKANKVVCTVEAAQKIEEWLQ